MLFRSGHLKSQAQGFIFLVTFGAGLLVGNFICARLIEHYKTPDGYNWDAIWGITTFASLLLLAGFLILFKERRISSKNDVLVPDMAEKH